MEREPKVPPTQDILSKYKNKRERKVIEKTEGKEGKEERERNRKGGDRTSGSKTERKKGRASIALADIRGAPGWQNE